MEITCESCHRPIPATNVNLNAAIATCTACNKAFKIQSQLGQKPQLGPVEGIAVTRLGSDLLIERRWYSAAAIAMLVFCIFWDGFLVVWYTIAFSKGAPLAMKLFPLIHVAVGLGLTYATICALLNTTGIRVSSKGLEIRHYPLPWWGEMAIERSRIEQLFVRKVVTSTKNGTRTSYNVEAKIHGGKNRKLSGSIQDYNQALKIEQEIEAALGIQDKPVDEEHRVS